MIQISFVLWEDRRLKNNTPHWRGKQEEQQIQEKKKNSHHLPNES